MKKLKVAVGSTNPVKIRAAEEATAKLQPVLVKGFSVPSGIDEQPRTDVETRQGAHNRAQGALQALIAEDQDDATYLGIGLEGGVFTDGEELWSTVWVVVLDQEGNEFVSNGARIPVPEPIASLIREGGEMGPMVAQLTGKTNIKHQQGMIGIITEEYTDRKIEYQAIALLAVGQWFGRNWRQQLQK